MCLTRVPDIVWTDTYGWVWLDYDLFIIYNIFIVHLNKSLVSWNQSFCTDVRPKEPVEKHNRIIIRDNNSLE